MNRSIVLSCALLTLVAGGASAIVVEAQFVGSIDFSSFRNYAWKEGTPAPNFQVEQAIRKAVDSQLAAKGYRASAAEADFYVVAHTVKDRLFAGGVLRIEIVEAAGGKPGWLGMASGVVTAESPKKRQKLAAKAIKKMFKHFPEATR